MRRIAQWLGCFSPRPKVTGFRPQCPQPQLPEQDGPFLPAPSCHESEIMANPSRQKIKHPSLAPPGHGQRRLVANSGINLRMRVLNKSCSTNTV